MPVYLLEPIEGGLGDRAWEASDVKEGCWVLADSEDHARVLVEGATLRMTDLKPGRPVVYSPWRNAQLTTCKPDNPALDVRKGIIVTKGGRTIDA